MKIKNKILIFLPIIIITYWLSVTIAAPLKDKTKPVISNLTVSPSISNGAKPNIVKFKVSEPAKVSISIVSKSRVIKAYSTQLKKAGFISWGWSGSKANGTYSLRINAVDPSKNSSLKTSTIIIDKVKPSISQHGFNLNPVKLGIENLLTYTANELVVAKLTISSQSGVVYTGNGGNGYNKIGRVVWDGKDQSSKFVQEGQYTYSLRLTDKAGNYQTVSRKFTVEGPPKIEIMPLALPFEPQGTNSLEIVYNLSEEANVKVEIYKEPNVIKEVFTGSNGQGLNSLSWDGKDSTGNIVAPGTYTLKITATDSKNNTSEAKTTIDTTGISLIAAKADGKDLVENALDKAVIKLTIAGDTFKNNILASNFQLNNAPQGLTISLVKRNNETSVDITLAFTGDSDIDISNFNITAKDTALTKGKDITSGNLKILAVIESIFATKADGNFLDLTEKTLNGAVVRLNLSGDTYKTTITNGDIELINPPAGQFGVKTVKRVDSNVIEITLDFNGDFDNNITNFSIRVKGNVLTSNNPQQTGNITLTAVNELTAANQNGTALALTEYNLDGAKIRLTLNSTTFKQVPTKSNIGLSQTTTPSTVDFDLSKLSVANVTAVGTSNNIIDIELDYIYMDFDQSVTDLTITILPGDLTSNRPEVTLQIPITAIDELQATNSDRSALNLNEGNLNGALIRLNLFGGDTFKPVLNVGNGRTTGDIRLSNNAPAGLKITNLNRVSTTELLISLSFDANVSANDFDADITNFYFIAVPTALNSGGSQTTKKADIKAFAELLVPTKTDGNALNLVENNLSSQEAKIRLTLYGDTFKTGIDEGDFKLTNIPTGLTIASISRVSDNVVDLTLGFNTNIFDFDINYDVTISALNTGVTTGREITTNPIVLRALVETLIATKTDGNTLALVESNLNTSIIRLNLSGATFKDSYSISDKIQLSFAQAIAPGTISIGSINRINDSTVDITINYTGADFDSDYNMTIKILSTGMNYSNVDLTDTVKISSLIDKVEATNADGTSTAGAGGITLLKRTTSTTATLRLVLTDDKFQPQANLDASDFQLNLGLPITGITRISDTVVDLNLGGNFNADVPGLIIQVNPTALTRNIGPLTTGSLTISAS